MSVCTAEQIAEKKRIALERLKAKKNVLASALNAGVNGNGQKPKLDEGTRTINEKTLSNTTHVNRAADFYKSLKQSEVVRNRLESRTLTSPYTKKSPSCGPSLKAESESGVSTQSNNAYPVFSRVVNCSVYMISPNRFAVEPSSFHTKLIEVFKMIPSKSYDATTKLWTFALKDYDLVRTHVGNLRPDIVIGEIPKAVLNLCRMPTIDINYSCLASIEPKLVEELMPFQRQGVCFAISHHGRLMICDEMGLGKTYQALAIADFYKEDWPLLIATTATTRDMWASHIRNLLPSVPCHNVLVYTSSQQYLGDAKILITSYSLISEDLLEKKFGFLIFDESHTLKNGKAKCTVNADRLSVHAKRILLLSGTPALSRPFELFSQIRMINRRFMTYTEYTNRYCDARPGKFGTDVSGQSNLSELKVVLSLKFMIRRLKSDVLPEMAEKSRETVTLDPELIWISKNIKTNLSKYASDLSQSKGKAKEEILLRYYAETASVKAQAVCAYLKTLFKRKKFIVFAHHKIMIDAICRCLEDAKMEYIRIDGSTRNDLRAHYVDTFQKKSSCTVAVLSLKSCNAGITLTEAEMVVFAELDWNPSTLAQAESRAHRIGQQKTVVCRYLMAANTVDDVIWNMLKSKQDVLSRAGLFCENLQDASHSAAPLSTNKIEKYFDHVNKSGESKSNGENEAPMKLDLNEKNETSGNECHIPLSENAKQETIKDDIEDLFSDELPLVSSMEFQVSNDNIDDLFNDDDDAFKDLMY